MRLMQFAGSEPNLQSTYLRIPLPWMQSTTYAFFNDESHRDIRKVYVSPPRNTQSAVERKRYFCGYCGDGLSLWREEPREEAEWIGVAVGSLHSDGRARLQNLGMSKDLLGLGSGSDGQQEDDDGVSWWEWLVGKSQKGNVTRSSGIGQTADGARVEWEIIEYIDDGDAGKLTAKRKLGALDKEDAVMDGLH